MTNINITTKVCRKCGCEFSYADEAHYSRPMGWVYPPDYSNLEGFCGYGCQDRFNEYWNDYDRRYKP